jgi:hypothetical protein
MGLSHSGVKIPFRIRPITRGDRLGAPVRELKVRRRLCLAPSAGLADAAI